MVAAHDLSMKRQKGLTAQDMDKVLKVHKRTQCRLYMQLAKLTLVERSHRLKVSSNSCLAALLDQLTPSGRIMTAQRNLSRCGMVDHHKNDGFKHCFAKPAVPTQFSAAYIWILQKWLQKWLVRILNRVYLCIGRIAI